MLLQELNLRALNVNASSVLPVNVTLNVEGKEVTFKITAFHSVYGSGKKSVVSGSIHRADNDTTKLIENADIEKVRRVVSSLCELTRSGRTTRTSRAKVDTEVKKLSGALAVARRLPSEWIKIDVVVLRAAFQEARKKDRANTKKALQARAVDPLLVKIAKLSDEERSLLLASLQ